MGSNITNLISKRWLTFIVALYTKYQYSLWDSIFTGYKVVVVIAMLLVDPCHKVITTLLLLGIFVIGAPILISVLVPI